MATAAAATPPRAPRSFAGLLEEYAAPQKKSPPAREPGSPWGEDFDGLEDDVATLTYEHALKAHGRYRREPELTATPAAANAAAVQEPPIAREVLPDARPQDKLAAASESSARKSASVTVRLTATENEQLRGRAAEAGLTFSAYLRSCAFEVESLRAQVKEAVAKMRVAEERAPEERRPWLWRVLRRRPEPA